MNYTSNLGMLLPLPFRRGEGRGEGSIPPFPLYARLRTRNASGYYVRLAASANRAPFGPLVIRAAVSAGAISGS